MTSQACVYTSAVLLQTMADDGREALGERRTRGFQSEFAVHIRDVTDLNIMYCMVHLSRFNVHLSTVAFSAFETFGNALRTIQALSSLYNTPECV